MEFVLGYSKAPTAASEQRMNLCVYLLWRRRTWPSALDWFMPTRYPLHLNKFQITINIQQQSSFQHESTITTVSPLPTLALFHGPGVSSFSFRFSLLGLDAYSPVCGGREVEDASKSLWILKLGPLIWGGGIDSVFKRGPSTATQRNACY